MSYDISDEHTETRAISGCNVRLFFSKEKNNDVENYVLSNLLETFEKRHNLCGIL